MTTCNPIFTPNPLQALAVARALGALQGPETAPEERLRVLLGLANKDLRVVSVEDTARALFTAGLRIGPIFIGIRGEAHTPLPSLESVPQASLDRTVGVYAHIFTALPHRDGPRAERKRRRAMDALGALTGHLAEQDPQDYIHRDFTHFSRPNKVYDAYTATNIPLTFYQAPGIPTDYVLRTIYDMFGGERAVIEEATRAIRDFGRRVITPMKERAKQQKGE